MYRFQIPAYCVHLLTASGVVPTALAMHEITRDNCSPPLVFLYLLLANFIDAIDGPLARRLEVKRYAAAIDGRVIDDLVDYLTFVFVPLMLIWRMDWLPTAVGWTVSIAMGASLLGFAHRDAKDETGGFFRGFPSYWNVFAFYAGIAASYQSHWINAVSMGVLSILTVSPIAMIYPNLAPQPWRSGLLGGAVVWVLLMVYMLGEYPAVRPLLVAGSLVYPVFYTILSLWLGAARTRVSATKPQCPTDG